MFCEIDIKGVEHWLKRLKSDLDRSKVLLYFRKVAKDKLNSQKMKNLIAKFSEDNTEKRIAYIQPDDEKQLIISSSILPSIKNKYPEHKIYYITKSQNFDLINSHPDVEEVLEYSDEMVNPLTLEGKGDKKGVFDIVFAPHLSINNNYFRNCKDILDYNTYELS